jgi:tRNA (cytidine/uridine-2'-O-)-methyltransferase
MRSKNFLNIVLFEPEIPQNAGNIARMCVNNDLKLHLIKPLGFKLDDKYLKRSALDYWEHLEYSVHENWGEFLETENLNPLGTNVEIGVRQQCLHFLSSKATKSFWEVNYSTNDYLIFGSETRGLNREIYENYHEQMLLVPMSSPNARCLNLASTVQTVYYEAFRQLN